MRDIEEEQDWDSMRGMVCLAPISSQVVRATSSVARDSFWRWKSECVVVELGLLLIVGWVIVLGDYYSTTYSGASGSVTSSL
jgi:hypothetical protein